MICCTAKGLSIPLDTDQLYRLADTGRDNPLTNYFFASADGTRLVDALEDAPRFKAALQDVVSQFPALPLAREAQEVLELLTPPAPVPPRYPQVGDTNVTARVRHAVTGGYWSNQYDVDGYGHRTGDPYQVWVGSVDLDISANNYDTPPAANQNGSSFHFHLCFKTRTPVAAGQAVLVDIAQGNYAPYATNVRSL